MECQLPLHAGKNTKTPTTTETTIRFQEALNRIPAVNGGVSFHSGEPGRPVRFQDWLSRRRWAGFDPRPGASCGAVTGAPIRKRVIAVDFQPTALTHSSVEPRGSVSARFTPCRPKGHQPGFPRAANMGGGGPHPALVRNGMWRNPIETHVCGRLSGFGGGSGRATGGGWKTERTRFTPAVNGGIPR